METLQDVVAGADATILHRFCRLASSAGHRPCIYYGEDDSSIDYSGFDRLTNGLANALRAQGISRGDRISVFTSSALMSAIAMFGIWKAGAVYCPVNARLKGDILGCILADTDPALLLTDRVLQPELTRSVPGFSAQSIARIVSSRLAGDLEPGPAPAGHPPTGDDLDFVSLPLCNDEPVELCAAAADLASIIYTSGTTGDPKGVMQTHGWLKGLCSSLGVWTHYHDVVYCDLPMHHIGGALSMFCRGIWSGASIALWDRFSPKEFWERIRVSGASIVLLIDVMVSWILTQPESGEDRNNSLAKVHMQPLPINHREIARRFGFDFVIVGYGSSELGNAFTGFVDEFPDSQATPEDLWRGYSKPELIARLQAVFGEHVYARAPGEVPAGYMGVPTGSYHPSVRDEQDEEVPFGVDGQLALEPLEHEQFFSGYLNKPEKTAQAVRNGRFYSADIVVRDANGLFCFRDRQEGFIRVRGENVSAASIEADLSRNPQVAQCAVFSVPAREGNEDDIAAFVVAGAGVSLGSKEFERWIQEHLPKFMWPRHVRFVEEIPVTPTMKVEKYKLREELLREL
ncbi:MAG: AMP-binding protein [Halieaceae bacterium]|nr:AMP-binding protein [Halieaceae bacterium]